MLKKTEHRSFCLEHWIRAGGDFFVKARAGKRGIGSFVNCFPEGDLTYDY